MYHFHLIVFICKDTLMDTSRRRVIMSIEGCTNFGSSGKSHPHHARDSNSMGKGMVEYQVAVNELKGTMKDRL